MTKTKAPLVLAISVLMLAATAARGLLQAFELSNPYRWVMVGLLAAYSLLLFTDLAIARRFPNYLKLYFILQTAIIVTLLNLPLAPVEIPSTTDFYALLFLPLCTQAIMYFSPPSSYYWVTALTLSVVAALFLQYDNDWIKFSVTYILGNAMVTFLAVFYRNAEDAREELDQANKKLTEYAGKVEAMAVAEERNRLARDLHDSVTQSLYSLTLFAEAASEELSAGDIDTVAAHLKELRETSHKALQEMRLMIFELRPPELDKKGLALALQERLEAVEARSGITTDIKIEFEERLPSDIEYGLYSIAREAMNNILKHAQATRTAIRLSKQPGKIIFEIIDNGIGLDKEGTMHAGLGIKGMQERAEKIGAVLTLEAAAEGGTILKVEVPDDRNN